MNDALQYDAWYRTARGRWIAETEFALMWAMLRPEPGASLLDVGSGTGQFSHRFAAAGLQVVAMDSDRERLHFAQDSFPELTQVRGSALSLPFQNAAFDYVTAVTSLCFIEPPQRAVAEMWRVCRRGMVLGVLNRSSVLYYRKQGSGGYRGARWDRLRTVRQWLAPLQPAPRVEVASAVFLPGGGLATRCLESLVPSRIGWGGFLAISLHKG